MNQEIVQKQPIIFQLNSLNKSLVNNNANNQVNQLAVHIKYQTRKIIYIKTLIFRPHFSQSLSQRVAVS